MIEIKRNTQKATQTAQESPQQPAETREGINTGEMQKPVKKPLQPFTALDGSNYRAAYRAVCDFHERHNPPRLDGDGGAAYWETVCNDMSATAEQYKHDPFVSGMIITVYEELERQFKLLQERGGQR